MGHIFWNDSSRLQDSGEQIDVLAIGDSWFHYPFNNLISPLFEALERPTIYVIGENGARADELSTGSWLGNFRKMLMGYPQIRLVCISAGGNDFAGVGDLDDKILAPDCSGATTVEQCYRAGEPQGVFDSVETAYGDLLAAVAAVRPDLTVLVHNYDYAIPDGRALIGVRSWLKLPMDNARVPTAGAPKDGLRREIVRDLIDRFTLCLDDVQSMSPQPVELVWSAGTLADSDWANELHPKPSGFAKIVNDCWSGPARHALGLS
ncbi:MAG TPA: SGNH/GDSL hydrolase family protein [Casimicrobiaceae bacterium]|nr:SGNH/GDSL hydrolase family protein [Casimicrobiaceae bacterium]